MNKETHPELGAPRESDHYIRPTTNSIQYKTEKTRNERFAFSPRKTNTRKENTFRGKTQKEVNSKNHASVGFKSLTGTI